MFLFFDLDHTLWDFEANKNEVLRLLWDEYFPEKSTHFPEFQQVFDAHNEVLWADFRNGKVAREDLRWKRFARALLELRLPDNKLSEKLSSRFLELLPQQATLLPFAKELLDYCHRRHYPMAIITNGFDLTQRQKLRAAGIGGYFTEVFSSENCGRPKPHCDIFEMAQKASGAPHPADCLMIGDSLEADILGAQAAGWKTVFYNPAKTAHDASPTHEIGCLSELKALL